MENSKKWSYEDTDSWKVMFSGCALNNQSPINISTDTLLDCDKLCELSMKYVPSKCNVYKEHNNPTINLYNINELGNKINKSTILFKQLPYNLEKITIHTPSMHTIDGENYAAEICLWHNINDLEAVAISCLYQEGDHFGNPEEFVNEVINYFPKENIKIPKEVDVSDKWSPYQLIPKNKSFFNYKGSLPFPPCTKEISDETQVIHWVIFEEIGTLGVATIDMLRYNIGNNARPVQPLGSRNVFYNNNNKLTEDDESSKITSPIEIKDERYLKCVPKLESKKKQRVVKQTKPIDKTRMSREKRRKIQGWFYMIVFICIFYASLKFVIISFKTGFAQKLLQSRVSQEILTNTDTNPTSITPTKGGYNGLFKKFLFKAEQLSSRYFNK